MLYIELLVLCHSERQRRIYQTTDCRQQTVKTEKTLRRVISQYDRESLT